LLVLCGRAFFLAGFLTLKHSEVIGSRFLLSRGGVLFFFVPTKNFARVFCGPPPSVASVVEVFPPRMLHLRAWPESPALPRESD